MSRYRVDDDVADHLSDVIDELDGAIRELRSDALDSAIRDRDARVRATQPDMQSVRLMRPATAPVRFHPSDVRRRLCRIVDDEVFAYAMRGNEFIRECDHTLWAHERDGLLVSARSSTPFARRVGDTFYDLESDAPLYYEDAHADCANPCPSCVRSGRRRASQRLSSDPPRHRRVPRLRSRAVLSLPQGPPRDPDCSQDLRGLSDPKRLPRARARHPEHPRHLGWPDRKRTRRLSQTPIARRRQRRITEVLVSRTAFYRIFLPMISFMISVVPP